MLHHHLEFAGYPNPTPTQSRGVHCSESPRSVTSRAPRARNYRRLIATSPTILSCGCVTHRNRRDSFVSCGRGCSETPSCLPPGAELQRYPVRDTNISCRLPGVTCMWPSQTALSLNQHEPASVCRLVLIRAKRWLKHNHGQMVPIPKCDRRIINAGRLLLREDRISTPNVQNFLGSTPAKLITHPPYDSELVPRVTNDAELFLHETETVEDTRRDFSNAIQELNERISDIHSNYEPEIIKPGFHSKNFSFGSNVPKIN
ncbi:hypothetical protein EVAR_38120_1 [Eumeta japonica]|uniref:Uncharacterized protein n=1 Tax=Eumeta variegata TaxID=151549 RepID=A0A4C1X8I3_EUMVA|nr:hypothetical protein EVAR_38120_1 [Eumeta japonica]